MIKVEQIYKQYSGSLLKKKIIALRGVTLHVEHGEVFGIVGPNGAGKSTLLKILLGLVTPTSGSVQLHKLSPDDYSCRKSLGYLPENPCLYDNLNIKDHLLFIARVAKLPKDKIAPRIAEVLKLVGLGHVAHQPIRTFSKGMVQRAALACALCTSPQILILDEPMSGLDPMGRKMVLDIVRDYNAQGNTVLFCSHVLTDVERICDRIAIMNQGQLQVTVTPRELDTIEKDDSCLSPLETLFMRTVQVGGCHE